MEKCVQNLIMYVPSDELWNETREHLIKCGIEDLSMVDRNRNHRYKTHRARKSVNYLHYVILSCYMADMLH